MNLGRILDSKRKFKSYTGLDFSDKMLAIAKERFKDVKNASFIKQDLTQGLNRQKYDIIISTWVMSHLEEPSKVINDCHDHLAKKGKLMFIFLTKPRWYVNFWFYPWLRVFAAKYVTDKEIEKVKGHKKVKRSARGLATLLQIDR
jgi:2-polyprenyl-3-methyl-5-hydroxy-6-metoxy-1,4-benzoquinol methylase